MVFSPEDCVRLIFKLTNWKYERCHLWRQPTRSPDDGLLLQIRLFSLCFIRMFITVLCDWVNGWCMASSLLLFIATHITHAYHKISHFSFRIPFHLPPGSFSPEFNFRNVQKLNRLRSCLCYLFHTILESFDLFRSDITTFAAFTVLRAASSEKMLPFLHIFFHWFSVFIFFIFLFRFCVCMEENGGGIYRISLWMIHYGEHTASRNDETNINWWHTIYMCAYVMADRIQLKHSLSVFVPYFGRANTMQGTCCARGMSLYKSLVVRTPCTRSHAPYKGRWQFSVYKPKMEEKMEKKRWARAIYCLDSRRIRADAWCCGCFLVFQSQLVRHCTPRRFY